MTTTPAPTALYTTPDGDAYDDRQIATIERVRTNLLSGQTFAMHASSARSVYGYEPPLSRRDWSHVIVTLGRMAGESDFLAAAAREIIAHGVNLYGTRSQAEARVWDAARAVVDLGTWDDVLTRSGPEGGRHRDAQRPITLAMRLRLVVWLNEATAPLQYAVPTIGYAIDALCRAERVRTDDVKARR